MSVEVEKAQVMFKLFRKENWNNRYDRLEHFKRFPNLKGIVKELSKVGWIIIHKKADYIGISLNTQYKKEIFEFIEEKMPYLSGMLE